MRSFHLLRNRPEAFFRSSDLKTFMEKAPFDAIIVTCAPDHVPEPLISQLKEGGRLVIPVGEAGGVQQLVLLRKRNGQISKDKMLDVRFVPMTGKMTNGSTDE